MTGDGGGGNHRGAHEERSSGRAALAAFEVSVRGGGTDFPAHEFVGVHRQTHRTARSPPIEAGFDEDFVQTLGLGLLGASIRDRTGYWTSRAIVSFVLGTLTLAGAVIAAVLLIV